MPRGKMDVRSSPPGSFLAHYAHSLPGRPVEEWHGLEEHLAQTADLAESFASPFAPGWGRIVGLWHDAGKYRLVFQNRIGVDPEAHSNGIVDHSSVGALIAKGRGAPLLAFIVAGHHGGMPNANDLRSRLQAKQDLLTEARRDGLPKWIEAQVLPPPPDFRGDGALLSLWTRLLFSALVDGDFLDTEKFYARGVGRYLGPQPGLSELRVSARRIHSAKSRRY